MKKRTVYVWGVAILCFVVLMIVTPAIPQSEAYHDFADQREFLGQISLSLSLCIYVYIYVHISMYVSVCLYESFYTYIEILG